MPILSWLDRNVERLLCIIATAIMTIAMSYQVLARFVFNIPAPVSDEIAIYSVVWLTYFGSSLAVTQRRHIRITMLSDLLSPKGVKIMDIIANMATFGFMVFLTIGAYHMCQIAYTDNHTAGTMPFIPMWTIIAGLPLAFGLSCVRLIQDTRRHLRELAVLSEPRAVTPQKGA